MYIGCAGWSIPSSLRELFSQQGSGLARYSSVLPAVEINSSFYRPHRPDTYARWRDSVPEDFRFSVKLPRTITHEQRLDDASALLLRFLDEAGNLKTKFGCMLVQLPPSLVFDVDVATAFFSELRSASSTPVVCEARHPTWFKPQADELLTKFRIGRVHADPKVKGSELSTSIEPLDYFRLHGSPQMYRSSYSEEYLDTLFGELLRRQSKGNTVWCVFDNTADGAALPNALSLLARDLIDPIKKERIRAPFQTAF